MLFEEDFKEDNL